LAGAGSTRQGHNHDWPPATVTAQRVEPAKVCGHRTSQQNDGAAACLIVAEETAESLDLHPIAALVGWAASGCDPARMGIGPVPAVAKLFARTGLGFDDLDLIELNEAFAVQVLAVLRCWNWDDRSRLNVNGSGISLGHPIGATGARIMTTMLYELARRAGRFALETHVHRRWTGSGRHLRTGLAGAHCFVRRSPDVARANLRRSSTAARTRSVD
jgi:acetyl-CoA acetyltransferase